VGEVEDIPLFFTLIPVLALLSNYDRENCLINVGTEGAMHFWEDTFAVLEVEQASEPPAGRDGFEVVLIRVVGRDSCWQDSADPAARRDKQREALREQRIGVVSPG
jgi:hypothetical protein